MDREASNKLKLLEHMLDDPSARPTDLPLSLLTEITNNFSHDQEVGRGGFAVVYKGLLPNGRTVAVKKLSDMGMDEKKFNQEVGCLMMARHKNIARFLGYCADTQGKMWNHEGRLVMADARQRLLCFEFVPNGTLRRYITDASQGLEWKRRYLLIKGICQGLHCLHQKKIVHLDLKPENILLDYDMVPKIIDFGLSRHFDENQSQDITSNLRGTLGYLAPEFILPKKRVIKLKLDIYSLGVTIVEILTGRKEDFAIEDLLKSWSNRLEASQGGAQLEQVKLCAEIGLQCIESNPEDRPTTKCIIRKLDETEKRCGFVETDICTSPVTQMPQPDIVYTIRDEWSFISFTTDLRRIFAGHPEREDIFDRHKDPNLSSTRQHPVLPRYRVRDQPARWLHIKLQVADEETSTTLVVRDDDVTVYGFMNQNGVWYHLFVGTGISLPPHYNSVLLAEWETWIIRLMDDRKSYMEILDSMRLGKTFAADAVHVLSRFPDVADGDNLRLSLEGLITMFCESARIYPIRDTIARGWKNGAGFTMQLVNYMRYWPIISYALLAWKEHGYDEWSGHRRLEDIGIRSAMDALNVVHLVHNDRLWD